MLHEKTLGDLTSIQVPRCLYARTLLQFLNLQSPITQRRDIQVDIPGLVLFRGIADRFPRGALGIDGQINVGIVGSVDGHREIAAKLSAAARPINLPVVGDGEEGRLLAATA